MMLNRCLAIILLALTLHTAYCWNRYSDIRTGRVDIFNSANSTGSLLSSSTVPPSYSITFTSAISQTLSSGLGIVGFQTYVTNSFSINTTITNFLTTSMRITGKVQDDTIVSYLSVQYIAVGSNTYFLQVQVFCFLPTILSTGNGTRTQTRTSTTTFTNLALLCNVYLSGYKLSNTVGVNNYLSSTVTCPSGTSNLNYVFTTSQSNIVSQICYTTVIFCDICTKASKNYLQWGQIGQTSLSNTLLPSTSNINSATLSRYNKDNRMFWGISTFNVSRGFTRGFNFQTDYYSFSGNLDTNYSSYTNFATYQIVLSHFYIATRDCNLTNGQWFQVPTQTCQNNNSCWGNLTYTLNGTDSQFCNYCDYTCLTCEGSLSTNCKTCLNTTYRLLNNSNSCPCQTGYIDVGVSSCYPCQYYISGCTACSSITSCTACSSGFTLTPLGQCQCTTGLLVTGVCTTIPGCISAINYQGSIYCLACNASIHFLRSSNFTCDCETGFTVSSSQCVYICGDGIPVTGQQCDDGNLINGDGCSNKCKVETNFQCDNSDPPSQCHIIANVTGSLKYVQRVLTANQATFAINLQPEFDEYSNMDFAGYVSKDLPCIQASYIYLDHLLIFNCTYSKTIQGGNYKFNLTLDPRYFASGSVISIDILASGMNAKLTYDSNFSLYTPLQMMILVLDIIAIIVLLIACVTERMIGVEMIQTLQSVLYAMAMMKTCPSTLAPLQSLRYSNGYNQINGVDPIRRYTYAFAIGQVGLDQQFLLNYNISYFILIVVILLLIMFKIVLAKFELDKINEEKQFNRPIEMDQLHKSYRNIKKAFKIIFQRILFVLCFMSMFLVMFAVGVQFSRLQPAYYMISTQINEMLCGVAICIMVTFLAMVIMNGCYPVIRVFPMFMDKKYPVYYVVYNSTFITLITYLYLNTWVLYLLLLMAIGNLIYSLTYTPYREKLHNLTLAINQTTIIIAVATYLYEESTPFTDNNEGIFSIMVIIIVLLLYICVILSIYRLYRFYQYMKINKLSYDLQSDLEKSEKNGKLPAKENQDDMENIDNDKAERLKTSKALQPFQKEIYEDSKMNKGPLNAARFNNDNVETNREKNGVSKSRVQDEQNYDTFSKNKSKNNSFQIDPIDPNPREVRGAKSPYNEFGQLKLHNQKNEQEQRDALKEIKARLRKDFYHKVRQTQYKEPSQKQQLLSKKNDKPVNFQPSDYNDQ